jgi:hypothetical protein
MFLCEDLCMDKIIDEIIMYDCICMYVIFQFKTSVKLKRVCVEPLSQSYFRRLGKNRHK